MSSDSNSSISSNFLRFLKFFSLIALIGFPNVKEKEKGLKPLFCTLFVRFRYLPPWILSCKSQRWRCAEMNLKQHIKILRQSNGFGFLREKKRLQYKVYFSRFRHFLVIPNGEKPRNWVANLVLKFHDSPTVNESEIIIFLRQVWCLREKERVLGGEGGKTRMRRR